MLDIPPKIGIRQAIKEQAARAKQLGFVAPEMHGVGQQHTPKAAFAIYVKGGTGKAGVPVATLREERTSQRGEHGRELKSQPATLVFAGSGVVDCFFKRAGIDKGATLTLAARGDHACKLGHVVQRGEHARVARHATEEGGVFVVYATA